ncbi:MAG: TerB family tellurite resistance protein, partial [Thermodesulfobacteriota bacterium]
ERIVLVKTLAYLASVDGKITDEEVEYVNNIAKSLNITIENPFDNIKHKELEEVLAPLNSKKSKKIILAKLVNLAYADGEYCDVEKQGIQEIAKILNINSEDISSIENWVNRGIIWTQEGYNLINQ